MSRYNTKTVKPATGRGPIVTETTPSTVTYNGAPGYVRDAKGELYVLAVNSMVSTDTFYEKAGFRDARFEALVERVAVEDPEWMAEFLGWLRSEGNMRTASLVGALVAAKAMVKAKVPGSRQIVASVLQRADEPGEALACWISRYGKQIPKPVKRGVADAALRLYNEYTVLKYDTASHAVRFADVLELAHPALNRFVAERLFPGEFNETAAKVEAEDMEAWLSAQRLRRDMRVNWWLSRADQLYKYILDRRHNRPDLQPGELLQMIQANAALREVAAINPAVMLNAEMLKAAGMTWEDALSLVGAKVSKKALWEALIPTMGVMALARNLRNFDEAGVDDAAVAAVTARFSDPAQIAKSRLFPFRFLQAFEQAPSVRWSQALDSALNHSLANVPNLPGRTLVLVDTSASMRSGTFSSKSTMTPAKAAAVFGVVLAARCGADLYGFADGVFKHEMPKGASVIREVERFVRRTGEVGHGTEIAGSLRKTYSRHDRVFIVSDMQATGRGTGDVVPANVQLYGVNLGGYQVQAFAVGSVPNRHELSSLSDASFKLIPLLEAGRDSGWPWQVAQG